MLWLLRPKDYKARAWSGEWGGTAWAPIWDCTYGFVVRAGSEEEARRMAAGHAGDEETKDYVDHKRVIIKSPWLDSAQSDCIPLASIGEDEVIIMDFKAG